MAGETYGVVGVSASPDGAGIGAANTAGGADLVLDGAADGAVDTVLRESGIYRTSASKQVFNLANPGAGTFFVNENSCIHILQTGAGAPNMQAFDGDVRRGDGDNGTFAGAGDGRAVAAQNG